MQIFRVTRTRNRPVYGAWSKTGTQVKVVTRRALAGMIQCNTPGATYTITKIEVAEVGDFHDVTAMFIKPEDPDQDVWDYLDGIRGVEREPNSILIIDGKELRTECGHSIVTCHTDKCFRRKS